MNSTHVLHPAAANLLKQVVEWLVAGDFNAIAAEASCARISAEQMAQAVRAYGRTLIIPPSRAFEDVDSIRVAAASEATWSVRFDLWTLEEGRSDLSLECTISIQSQGGAVIEIDGIHVL